MVRDAKNRDTRQLADLFRDCWQHTYTGIIPHVHLSNMIRRRGPVWWRNALRSRDVTLMLDFEGESIGYATCGTSRSRGPYRGEIYELYLLPDYQGLGLGEHLFEACRYRLDQKSYRGLIVWALKTNTNAHTFYWRRGGRPVTTAYESLGGAKLEKIAFAWND
ncbi:MAG: GNAT family N-acetyltransferase [Hyphomicrobiaceae bacterium]